MSLDSTNPPMVQCDPFPPATTPHRCAPKSLVGKQRLHRVPMMLLRAGWQPIDAPAAAGAKAFPTLHVGAQPLSGGIAPSFALAFARHLQEGRVAVERARVVL